MDFFWKVNSLFGANRKVGKSLPFPHWHVVFKEELFIFQVNKPGNYVGAVFVMFL